MLLPVFLVVIEVITGNPSKDNARVRELYRHLTPLREDIIEDIFTPIRKIDAYDREFNKRIWHEGVGNQVTKHLAISPWATYWEGDFEEGSFEEYLNFAKSFWSEEDVFRSFTVFFYFVCDDDDIDGMSEIKSFLPTAIKWFQKRCLWIVWQGKQKEYLLANHLNDELHHHGYYIDKTPQEKDMDWMTDFIVRERSSDKIVKGYSVKSASYRNSSSYKDSGEAKERRGRERFKRETGATVSVAIASLDYAENAREARRLIDELLEEKIMMKVMTLEEVRTRLEVLTSSVSEDFNERKKNYELTWSEYAIASEIDTLEDLLS